MIWGGFCYSIISRNVVPMSSLCQLVYFLQAVSWNLQSDELLRNISDKATKERQRFSGRNDHVLWTSLTLWRKWKNELNELKCKKLLFPFLSSGRLYKAGNFQVPWPEHWAILWDQWAVGATNLGLVERNKSHAVLITCLTDRGWRGRGR